MLNNPKLLASYRRGDKEAFEILYNKYSSSLRRFLQGGFSFQSQGRHCRFKGVDMATDAESFVQEAFVRAFVAKTRENYDGVRPFQTYLFSIAKNLVLRECHQRERLISAENIEESGSRQSVFSNINGDIGSSPEKRAQNNELQNIIQQFVNKLNAEEESFFNFRFAKGHTQESAAVKMGTTRARVKLLEKNVRKRFLETLRSNGYFTDYSPKPRWRRKTNLPAIKNAC